MKKDYTNLPLKLYQAPDYVLSTASHNLSLELLLDHFIDFAWQSEPVSPSNYDAYVRINNGNLICGVPCAEEVLYYLRRVVKTDIHYV